MKQPHDFELSAYAVRGSTFLGGVGTRITNKLKQSSFCFYRFILFFALTGLLFCAVPVLADETVPSLQVAVKSGCEFDYPPFCLVEKGGRANGFSVDLLRAALQAMGHKAEFQVGSWSEVKGLLERGEIDALPLVGRTPEREPLFDFTFPYLSLHGVIVVPNGTSDIQNLDDLRGRQVAVMAGDNAEEFLRRSNFGVNIHTTQTFEEALRELSEGQHDAVIIQRLLALRLFQQAGITNLRMVGEPLQELQQDFCFAVKEGDKETLSLLNEGLALVMADGTFNHLQSKWFATLELPDDNHIVIGGDHNYPPYEYLDNNGRPAGYNVELTRAIAEATGLDVEIRLGPWLEIRQGLSSGEIDAVHGMFSSPERRIGFDFSPPHAVIQHVAVMRTGEGDPPQDIAELAGKRLVVMQGDIMHDWVQENSIDSQVTVVATQEDALRELSAGQHDCALLARVPAMYWIEKYGLDNLNIADSPLQTPEYCYAVPRSQGVLLAKLSEGLKILSDSGEYQRIYAKWMGVYEDTSPSLSTILRYVAVIIIPLLLFILLIWSRTLSQQVNRRTAELQESKERFKGMFDNMGNGVAVYKAVNDGEDFKFIDFNPAGEKIDDIAREAVLGKRLTDLFPGIVNFGLLDVLKRVWQTGQSEHHPITQYQDGRIEGWRDNFIYKLPSGEIVAIYNDVTESKQAEAEKERSRAFMQTVIDGVSDSLMVINRDYTITLANLAVREMVGEDPVTACLTCHQVSHGSIMPCDGDEHCCPLQKVIETKAPVTVEHTHLNDQGNKIYVELSAAPIFDEQGEVQQIIELCHDITERKRRESAITSQLQLSEFAAEHSVMELLKAFLDEAKKLTDSEIGFFHFVEKDQTTLKLQTWSTNTLKNLCTAEGVVSHYPIDKAGVWVECVREGRPVIHNDYANLLHRKGLPKGHAPVVRELVFPVYRGNLIVAILGVGNKKTDYHEEDVKIVSDLSNQAWDIVSRKRTEEALIESRNRYHQMFETNQSVKLTIDPSDGRIVEANNAAHKYYGYDSGTLTSMLISEINTLPPEEIQREMELARKEERKFFNFRHRLASGEVRDVEVYSGPLQSEGKTLLYSIVHDTTKRRQVEEKLRESSEFRENILSESPVGAAIYGGESGQCMAANKAFAELIDARVEQMIAQNFYEIASWKESGLLEMAISALRDNSKKQREIKLKTTFGKDMWADCYLAPFNAGGKKYLLFNLLDVTDRKQAEEEKQKLENQLRHSQKMEAVGQLAGGVAHDFNNLLQVILGYGEIALRDGEEVNNVRKFVGEMLTAANRATTLVDQLLAFSHRQVLDVKAVDLNQLIADLMKMIKPVIGAHVAHEIIADQNLGAVRADPGQLDQILMNLCVNACDAMPSGGKITIKTENVEIAEAYCEAHDWAKPGHYALISVTDTGSGMDDETIDSAFEPFFTTKGLGKGTGLGLSTVYGLVTQHQGMIQIDSEIDKGTTFKIYLPLIENSVVIAGNKTVNPASGGSETILIAEDEEAIRELSRIVLEGAGYTVLTACDGEEAIRVFEAHADKINLALLDVMMPKLGGHAVYENIYSEQPKVHVLFSSGYSTDAIHTNFVLGEGLALIQKPFQSDELLRRVRKALDNE